MCVIASVRSCSETEFSSTIGGKNACTANARVNEQDARAETNMNFSLGPSTSLETNRSADETFMMPIKCSEDENTPRVRTANTKSHKSQNRKMNLSAKNKKKVNGQFLVKCRGCHDVFESRNALKMHVENCHASIRTIMRTLECYLCAKTFSRLGSLQRHMNALHMAAVRFMCPIRSCSRIFTQKGNLKRHMNMRPMNHFYPRFLHLV